MSFLTPAVKSFIQKNANADVRKLAFCKSTLSSDELRLALQQIEGRQKASVKIPSWAKMDDIIYPVHLSLEQCSSEQTAKYKCSIVDEGKTMADLTGGFGIDFSFLSRKYEEAHYVELNAELCDIAEHNFNVFQFTNTTVHNTDAISFINEYKSPKLDLIFIDPARRDANGRKTVAPSDCLPDLTSIQQNISKITKKVLVKYSPMLDISTAIKELSNVKKIYIVSVNNECKELLLLQDFESSAIDTEIVCVDINKGITHECKSTFAKEKNENITIADKLGKYLYEPNSSIMKGGIFKSIANIWGVNPIQQNSHLYTSLELRTEFQGRIFEIVGTCKLNKEDFNRTFPNTKQANLTIRNCPIKQDDLRKKLKIKEGGDLYLFATTLINNELILIGCKKIRNQNASSAL